MKSYALFILVFSATSLFGQQKDYGINAVDFTKVKLTDKFWLPRIEMNRTVTIPASFERCESTGRVNNFIMAAKKQGKFCTKYPFDDSDIFKTIEGASFSLATHPDKKLELYLDTLIGIIGRAQEPDGYLYTARTIDPINVGPWLGKERWEKERELSHELYNAGHLYEAAAAHYLATKKSSLLDIAIKNANLVCSVFGPGKKSVAPGHEVIEMGLVKLYRITGKKEYLNTAKFFIEARGKYPGYDPKSNDPWKNGSYWQDHKPVVLQDEAEGHAVRAGYLYSAVADVAALTGDDSLLSAIDKIWENVVEKKTYVQGGVGALGDGERYGKNYELPNATAYNETCAAISNIYWNHRMFLLHGDSKYIDVLEKTLYNGMLSGIGLDGKSFFYTNAMQVREGFGAGRVESTRSGWFECSCCPTNLARIIPSIPGYVYGQKNDDIYINLFINSTTNLLIRNKPVEIIQQNNYPWEGNLVFLVSPSASTNFSLFVRIPGWAREEAMPSGLYKFESAANSPISIQVNGQPIEYKMQNGYAIITRTWKRNDKLEVTLPMEVRRVVANDLIRENIGKISLHRGPLTYCAEWPDNHGKTSNIILPEGTRFTTEFKPDLLAGLTIIKGEAPAIVIRDAFNISTVTQAFTAIPYYSWANRGKGEMMVWFPTRVKYLDLLPN